MSEKPSIKFLQSEVGRLTAELRSLLRVALVCVECGSNDILFNASARWDVETQKYRVANIHDNGHHCMDCDSLCEVEKAPIT